MTSPGVMPTSRLFVLHRTIASPETVNGAMGVAETEQESHEARCLLSAYHSYWLSANVELFRTRLHSFISSIRQCHISSRSLLPRVFLSNSLPCLHSLSVSIRLCLNVCSLSLSLSLFLSLCFCLLVCPHPLCLFVFLGVSFCASVCLCSLLSLSVPVCQPVCLSVCLSVYLSLSLITQK